MLVNTEEGTKVAWLVCAALNTWVEVGLVCYGNEFCCIQTSQGKRLTTTNNLREFPSETNK